MYSKNRFTLLLLISSVATWSFAALGDIAGDRKIVTSKAYVDTKQVKIPATTNTYTYDETNRPTADGSVVTTTTTQGVVSERGIATAPVSDGNGGYSNGDWLPTVGAMMNAINAHTPTGTRNTIANYDANGALGSGIATYDGSGTYAPATDAGKIATAAAVETKQDKIIAGTAGNVVTYTGTAGSVGSATVSSAATYSNDTLTNGNDIANITAVETKQDKIVASDILLLEEDGKEITSDIYTPSIVTHDSGNETLVGTQFGILSNSVIDDADIGWAQPYLYSFADRDDLVPTVAALMPIFNDLWKNFSNYVAESNTLAWTGSTGKPTQIGLINSYTTAFSGGMKVGWPTESQNYWVNHTFLVNALALKQNKIASSGYSYSNFLGTLVSYNENASTDTGSWLHTAVKGTGLVTKTSTAGVVGERKIFEESDVANYHARNLTRNQMDIQDISIPTVGAVKSMLTPKQNKINSTSNGVNNTPNYVYNATTNPTANGSVVTTTTTAGTVGERGIATAPVSDGNGGYSNGDWLPTVNAMMNAISSATPTISGTRNTIANYDANGALGSGIATYDGSGTYAPATDAGKIATAAAVETKQNKIPAGTSGNVVTYTGTAGSVGSVAVASAPSYTGNTLNNGSSLANITAVETKQDKITTGNVMFYDDPEGTEGDMYVPGLVAYDPQTSALSGNKIGILDQETIENDEGGLGMYNTNEYGDEMDNFVPTVRAVAEGLVGLELIKQDKIPAAWTDPTSDYNMASTGGQTIDLTTTPGGVGRRYITAGGSQPLTQKSGADNVILYINGTKTLAQYQTSNFGAIGNTATINQNYITGALVSLELLKDVYSELHTEIQNATPTGTPGNVAMYDASTGELGDGVATYDGSTTYNASTDAGKIATAATVETKQDKIIAGTAGNVVTYTGTAGNVGSATVSSAATYTNDTLQNGNDIANITAVETKVSKTQSTGYQVLTTGTNGTVTADYISVPVTTSGTGRPTSSNAPTGTAAIWIE